MTDRNYFPGEAARRLGITPKALRVYEARGLLAPQRSLSGRRLYDQSQMVKAAEIVRLRNLGLSLTEILEISGHKEPLERVLARHLDRVQQTSRALAALRERISVPMTAPSTSADMSALRPQGICFPLPWPWQGETFALGLPTRLTFIVGPLGSGKTCFCEALASALPGGVFIDLDRTVGLAVPIESEAVRSRVNGLERLGATPSAALERLICALEASKGRATVVDLVEAGLDGLAQHALMHDLRAHDHGAPLIIMTRSSIILDLSAVSRDEAIILCPANHSPPAFVAPYRGAPGFETLESCLGTPEARARSAGVVATRQKAA
jgi:DNA-binding transcriptional MerR regulator